MASAVVFMISDVLLGFMAAMALAAGLPSVGAGSVHDSTSFTRTRRVAAETDAPMRTDAWCTAPTMLDRRPCVATVRGATRAGEPPIARVRRPSRTCREGDSFARARAARAYGNGLQSQHNRNCTGGMTMEQASKLISRNNIGSKEEAGFHNTCKFGDDVQERLPCDRAQIASPTNARYA
jgi:hypothetical protein